MGRGSGDFSTENRQSGFSRRFGLTERPITPANPRECGLNCTACLSMIRRIAHLRCDVVDLVRASEKENLDREWQRDAPANAIVEDSPIESPARVQIVSPGPQPWRAGCEPRSCPLGPQGARSVVRFLADIAQRIQRQHVDPLVFIEGWREDQPARRFSAIVDSPSKRLIVRHGRRAFVVHARDMSRHQGTGLTSSIRSSARRARTRMCGGTSTS